jgi:hypothetical protein
MPNANAYAAIQGHPDDKRTQSAGLSAVNLP